MKENSKYKRKQMEMTELKTTIGTIKYTHWMTSGRGVEDRISKSEDISTYAI